MFSIPLKQNRRYILHIDADAFFASVEQILDPTLKGRPVLVGGPSRDHGIVSAASYEARKFGVSSAMPMYLARRKCPQAIIVNGHFEAYGDFSRRLYHIFLKYTPDTEMASIDEAYLDITGCEKMHKMPAKNLARKILYDVHEKLGLSVSCGMASSKTVAKVASSMNKPHKFTFVPFGKEKDFLAPFRLDCIPGVGPKTFYLLQKYGLEKVRDLISLSSEEVMAKFGVGLIPLWKRCMGIDDSRVIGTPPLPKSISKEHTFYNYNLGQKFYLKTLKELSGTVFEKLRRYKMKANTVCVKIRYKNEEENGIGAKRGNFFRDFSFQTHLQIPSSIDSELFPVARDLFLRNLEKENVRLIGVGVANLKLNYNLNLFGGEEKERLFSSLDKVRELYGDDSLRFGI